MSATRTSTDAWTSKVVLSQRLPSLPPMPSDLMKVDPIKYMAGIFTKMSNSTSTDDEDNNDEEATTSTPPGAASSATSSTTTSSAPLTSSASGSSSSSTNKAPALDSDNEDTDDGGASSSGSASDGSSKRKASHSGQAASCKVSRLFDVQELLSGSLHMRSVSDTSVYLHLM